MSARATRRNHAERMKRKARRLYPHDPAAKFANHLAQCSCMACGNPRHHFGYLTRREKVAILRERDERL